MPKHHYWTVFFTELELAEIDRAGVFFHTYDRVPFGTANLDDPDEKWLIMVAKLAELLNAYGPRDFTAHTNRMKEMDQEAHADH